MPQFPSFVKPFYSDSMQKLDEIHFLRHNVRDKSSLRGVSRMNENPCCTLCGNRCPLTALACPKGQRFYELNEQPYCTLCDNHCLLSELRCHRGAEFYGGGKAGDAPQPPFPGGLTMRYELCWHQFRRVRGAQDGQVRVLRFLSNHGTATQRELQEILGIKSAAMSEHLTSLETKGYITRASSERDKRTKIISLTAAGKARFAQVLAEEEKKDLFGSLTPGEQDTLKKLLIKLSADWRNRRSAEK